VPISLTVTGTERILGSLENLRAAIVSPDVVQNLADMASQVMSDNAPVGVRGDAGLLQRTLSEVSVAQPTGNGWQIGVGNMQGIYPLEPAPRGTISAFLKKWAEEHGETGERKRKRTGTGFDPRKAWMYLSDEQKDRLRQMREAGEKDVGGSSPYRPFYWYVQDRGSEGASITGSGYIASAMSEIRQRIPGILRDTVKAARAYRRRIYRKWLG